MSDHRPGQNKSLKVFRDVDILENYRKRSWPHWDGYLAMYSSIWNGVTRDPWAMTLPVDDHLVHRGDGVFEAIKCVSGWIYGLNAHLQRLARSAEQIGLVLPHSLEAIAKIIDETIGISGARDCLVRVYVSRGPGGFGVSPYESIGSQLYVVITRLQPPSPEKFKKGVRVITSRVPIKPDFFATIKSCNYLPNVLMKKEALDHEADYAVSLDERGYWAEGATENIALISEDLELVVPGFARTLAGITVSRALELAKKHLIKKDGLKDARQDDIDPHQAQKAREIFMLGTTIDVLPVVYYDGAAIGGGVPGPWAKQLLQLIQQDLMTESFSRAVTNYT